MKTKLFKISIITLVFVAAINGKFYADTLTKEIHWVNTYDEGLKIANEKDKNMFILITAPTWCHYCKQFEKKVLTNEKIKSILNENYVPVLVLDQINGKRNPDLSRFSFPGFPTVYVYNKSGKMVKDV
ncbi:MAG: thioredoxin family protein, partial [Candidatus Anammoxibacter sp.]